MRRLVRRIPTHRASRSESRNTRVTHLRESLRAGLWFIPLVCIIAAAMLSALTISIDRRWEDPPGWLVFDGGATSAQQVLATIAASMLTFTALVFSITIVSLQLASSQFSPRVLRAFLRDRGSQVALGVFTATFVYSLSILVQVRAGTEGTTFVPGLSVSFAIVLVTASLAMFVYYVNHVAQSLRVVNIIESVATETRKVLDSAHPANSDRLEGTSPPQVLPECRQQILMGGDGGGGAVVSSLDAAGLVQIAERHDCVLRLVPNLGDYVAEGAPLMEVLGGTDVVSKRDVEHQIGIGSERTMHQDALYGFRQLVDIAVKALSPAINDPTTAVQALDRIHDLLRRIVDRPAPSGCYHDESGELRFVRSVVSWSALVVLAYEEIRAYGGSSVQVHRRLRASLEQLLEIAPPENREPLLRQLRLQEQSAERYFPEPEERELAAVGDESGLGSDDADDDGPIG